MSRGALKLKTSITISRPTCSDGRDVITVRVRDEASHCTIIEVEVASREFAHALTGLGDVPCVAEFYADAPIGKAREHKTEVVPRPDWCGPKAERETVAASALAAFEVDGWKGDPNDLFNSHKWTETADGLPGARVMFVRHVES
jgi:hypothetical protein